MNGRAVLIGIKDWLLFLDEWKKERKKAKFKSNVPSDVRYFSYDIEVIVKLISRFDVRCRVFCFFCSLLLLLSFTIFAEAIPLDSLHLFSSRNSECNRLLCVINFCVFALRWPVTDCHYHCSCIIQTGINLCLSVWQICCSTCRNRPICGKK